MRVGLDRVRLQPSVVAQALARRAEQRQSAIDNALSNSMRSRRFGWRIRIANIPIPNRMSLMPRKLVSMPQRLA